MEEPNRDHPEGPAAHGESPSCPRAARRGVKTSHVVLGAAAALIAIAAVVGGLRAADDLAGGYQLTGWQGGWHHAGPAEPDPIRALCSDRRDGWLAERIGVIEAFVSFTPTQAPAWQNLKGAIDEASVKVGVACADFEDAGRPVTAPEHLERAEVLLATGFDVVQGLRPAVDGLYATLEPEQRAALDRLARRRPPRD